jgi:P27 family predicted phage terminase small subunit
MEGVEAMGNWNSGRRRIPSRLQVLRGKRKTIRADEPQPAAVDASFDAPPAELDGNPIAHAEWARVVPILRRCGLVSQTERSALVALCQQWAIYLEAQAKVRSLGMIITKGNGLPATNPHFAVADRALKQCQKLWSELGLTASSRSRIAALPEAEPQEQSKWAGLL